MQYMRFGPDLEGVPNVIVDGAGIDSTVLVLSHWPGSATPAEFKADTSTEIVLNYLRSDRADELLSGAEALSNNHFDIDGLMGIWAMLNAEQALEHAGLLNAIAECGDFERWEGEHAAKAVCAINGLETSESSPFATRLTGVTDHNERTGILYEEMLERVPALLYDIDSLEELWFDEYARIEAGRAMFTSGEATVKEVSEIDLAVFTLPELVHTIAMNEQTQCSRVALIVDDERHLARYRYESWVEYVSREVPARIDLRPFAEFLQTFEGNAGYWEADDVANIVPEVRLRDGEDELAPSSITSGLFVRMLGNFLRDNADNESLRWSSATASIGS